jgi:hypothetical protein
MVKVPRIDEYYDMESEEEKNLTIAADMNELSYTEKILSIDDKASTGKVEFNLVNVCKNKNYAGESVRRNNDGQGHIIFNSNYVAFKIVIKNNLSSIMWIL